MSWFSAEESNKLVSCSLFFKTSHKHLLVMLYFLWRLHSWVLLCTFYRKSIPSYFLKTAQAANKYREALSSDATAVHEKEDHKSMCAVRERVLNPITNQTLSDRPRKSFWAMCRGFPKRKFSPLKRARMSSLRCSPLSGGNWGRNCWRCSRWESLSTSCHVERLTTSKNISGWESVKKKQRMTR